VSAAALPIEKAVLGLAEYGWLGVDLFFALSGFLITGILLDSRERPRYFRTFIARRALRIFPLYYTSLFLLLVVGPHLYAPLKQRLMETPGADVWAWTYLLNVRMTLAGGNAVPAMLQHFWSLAVEEQFYIIWPLLVFFSSNRRMAYVCVFGFVLSVSLRIFAAGYFQGPVEWLMPARLDALAVGAMVALFVRHGGKDSKLSKRSMLICIVLGVILCGTQMIAIHTSETVTHRLNWLVIPLSALAFGLLILHVVTHPTRLAFLRGRFLTYLGRRSYAIYVFHQPLAILLLRAIPFRRLPPQWEGRLIVYFLFGSVVSAVSLAAAFASWHLLEKHFLRMKEGFSYGDVVASVRRSKESLRRGGVQGGP
jgi:peptidoglycan/LPS O-acetylase OafA/YrhL